MPDPIIDPEPDKKILEKKGEILKRLIDGDKKARKTWYEKGEEINKYAFALDAKIEMEDEIDIKIPFNARLSKGFQFISIIGWSIFQQNQERTVHRRKGFYEAPQQKGPDTDGEVLDVNQLRSKLVEDYLNYIPKAYGAETHKRRAISDCCIFGLGVLESGWDSKRNIAISSHIPIKNYIVDSDATCEADCHRKTVVRYKPRWWLKKHYPDSIKAIKDANPTAVRPSDEAQEGGLRYSTDTIKIYDTFMDIGLHHYREGDELANDLGVQDDSPKRYITTEEGTLLAELPWPVPLHRSNKWPFTEYRMIDSPSGYYPVQPMLAGLPQLKAMDWIYRSYLAKMQFAIKTIVVAVTEQGNDPGTKVIDAVTSRGLLEIVPWTNKGQEGKKISELLQQINLTSGVEELERYLKLNDIEFQKAVGLYDFLYTGDTPRQMRTTSEVNIRQSTSNSRIEEFRYRMDDSDSELAAKEAQIAKFLSEIEDIAKVFGPERAQLWGFIMPPLQERVEALKKRYSDEVAALGAPPEIASKIASERAQTEAPALQAADEAKGGYEFDKWVMETDFTVVAGSAIRKDKQRELDLYKEAASALWPTMMQSPSPQVQAAALMGMKAYYEENGASDDVINNIQLVHDLLMQTPPPPPPGTPEPPPPPEPPTETTSESNAAIDAALQKPPPGG